MYNKIKSYVLTQVQHAKSTKVKGMLSWASTKIQREIHQVSQLVVLGKARKEKGWGQGEREKLQQNIYGMIIKRKCFKHTITMYTFNPRTLPFFCQCRNLFQLLCDTLSYMYDSDNLRFVHKLSYKNKVLQHDTV